ncbi:hypothetical protein IW254_000491 [Corynebacterium aquatimens]|uniref:Uncharacterized protein n=1 Tax=Corynebacterium aquatimens TaxID=1190508 RepID=A0A931E0B9_9CORY|nr:hypothetical protein [Corynebacterium aquatimens]
MAEHVEYSPNSTTSTKILRAEGVNVVLYMLNRPTAV